jgi:uncharacterized C2H2 Zn-finger protein
MTPTTVHRCPKCDGIAKLDEQHREAAMLHFRCPYCNHVWKVAMATQK